MADRRAFLQIDIDADIAKLALQVAPIVADAAKLLKDEIRRRIPDTDVPSAPGDAPSSTGPYRDSWKAGRARRRRDFVQADTYSVPPDGNVKLAAILEHGSREAGIAPRPHIRPAEAERAVKMDAHIQKLNARNLADARKVGG